MVKRFGAIDTLKGLAQLEQGGKFFAEYEAMEKEAAVGREYKDTLRNEVLRLALLSDPQVYEALAGNAKLMSANELEKLKGAFEKRLEDSFPPKTQLPGTGKTVSFDGDVYMV